MSPRRLGFGGKMGQSEGKFVGKFVGGHYVVKADVDRMDAAITAAHEEAHGILRRSSAYGAILRTAEASFAERSDGDGFGLHALASRSRTSEEVHATYQSYRLARSYATGAPKVDSLLGQYPSYRMYYKIGHELVGGEPIPQFANAALDAIVRFCWSAAELDDVDIPVSALEALKRLPPAAFPDERLRRLRKAWNPHALGFLVDAMLGENPDALRRHFDKDPAQLADPVGEAIRKEIPDGALFLTSADFDVALNAERKHISLMTAMMQEQMVVRGYEALAERYRGTDLASMEPGDLRPYLERVDRSLRTLPEIPQVTILRTRPLCINAIQTNQGTSSEILFVRPSESFLAAFDTSALPFQISPGEVVLYIPEVSLESVVGSTAPVDFQVAANAAADLDSLLGLLFRSRPMLVAVFASAMKQASPEAWLSLRTLARLDHRIWIVGDLPARECAQLVREWMPEMRGFWHAKDGNPNVGALVVPQVGDAGVFEGMVLTGSRMNMVGLARSILTDELGDDFRGFGDTIFYFDWDARRQRGGDLLSDWLLAMERTLNG
jgi:hypothetical protein